MAAQLGVFAAQGGILRLQTLHHRTQVVLRVQGTGGHDQE
jgi:hypothetical protein